MLLCKSMGCKVWWEVRSSISYLGIEEDIWVEEIVEWNWFASYSLYLHLVSATRTGSQPFKHCLIFWCFQRSSQIWAWAFQLRWGSFEKLPLGSSKSVSVIHLPHLKFWNIDLYSQHIYNAGGTSRKSQQEHPLQNFPCLPQETGRPLPFLECGAACFPGSFAAFWETLRSGSKWRDQRPSSGPVHPCQCRKDQ